MSLNVGVAIADCKPHQPRICKLSAFCSVRHGSFSPLGFS